MSTPLFQPKQVFTKNLSKEEIIKKIQKLTMVEKIKDLERNLLIITKEIKLENKNIGKYIITIDTLTKNIKVEREQGMILDRYDHPFIEYGSCCFGNHARQINICQDNSEWFGITIIILELLKCTQHNENDYPYMDVDKWLERI